MLLVLQDSTPGGCSQQGRPGSNGGLALTRITCLGPGKGELGLIAQGAVHEYTTRSLFVFVESPRGTFQLKNKTDTNSPCLTLMTAGHLGPEYSLLSVLHLACAIRNILYSSLR